MADQPEALRLADELGGVSDALADRAAAELRRLVAENELLASALDKLRSVFRDERMELLRQRDQATAQRDELLEALKLALSSHGVMLMSDPPQDAWKVNRVEAKACAAIAKAEEQK
jgi:hypothetical protein